MQIDFEKIGRGTWRTVDRKFVISAYRSKWLIGENVEMPWSEAEYIMRALTFPTLTAAKAYIIQRYYSK